MENKNDPSSENVKKKSDQIIFEVPAEGSLGLLALGAVGIRAWRKKREEVKSQQIKKENE